MWVIIHWNHSSTYFLHGIRAPTLHRATDPSHYNVFLLWSISPLYPQHPTPFRISKTPYCSQYHCPNQWKINSLHISSMVFSIWSTPYWLYLLDYVKGTFRCPSSDGTAAEELRKTHWVRQDKLILSAILASTSPSITPLIATAKSSHEAWKKLTHLYASWLLLKKCSFIASYKLF